MKLLLMVFQFDKNYKAMEVNETSSLKKKKNGQNTLTTSLPKTKYGMYVKKY